MSISRQNLSIVIVTLKSENVINKCIESIDKEIPIIVIENSNNFKFKEYLEKTYNNVKCILSNKNLGMGSGNNVGIEYSKTDYVLILNPDVILENNTIKELIEASKIINDFALLRNQWLGITKGLDQKQWQITNIVKLRVAGMEDATIK